MHLSGRADNLISPSFSLATQITSKLWGTWHNRVEECLDQTLTNLGTDYLDCKYTTTACALECSALNVLILPPSTSVPYTLACSTEPEWEPSSFPSASKWKAGRVARVAIERYLEANGRDPEEG